MKTRFRFLGPLFWLLCVAATVAVLHKMGSGSLSLPAMNREAWHLWLVQSDAVTVTFALTRLFALVLAWYVLATSLLSFLAAGTRRESVLRVTDLVSVPLIRRLARQLAGLSVAGTIAFSGPAYAEHPDEPVEEAPVLRHVESFGSHDLAPAPTTTTMSVTNSPPTTTTAITAPYTDTSFRASHPEPPILATYTISPGENFWVIADRVMTSRLRRAPSPEEVAWYWRELVERNRGALADGDNPDLVFPGQVLQLP